MTPKDDTITIDTKKLLNLLWSKKWIIILGTVIFTALGGLYAFSVREEFVSEGKILPEITGNGTSSLGGLASLVGIGGFELGMKNNTEAIRPDLYPDVLSSSQFFLSLLNQKLLSKDGDSLTFKKYYSKTIEENEKPEADLLKLFKASPPGVLVINRLTENRIKDLRERIIVKIDNKSGIISISSKMPDPVIAAQVSNFAMAYLTNYVSNYRTQKLKQEVDFLGRKVASAKGEFYQDQVKKASYADQFSASTMRLQSSDIRRERLESEYKLSSSVYNELLKKFEEAKIRLQQETPVFQVLDIPIAPNKKSEPQKAIILIISTVLGFIASTFLVIILKGNLKQVLK